VTVTGATPYTLEGTGKIMGAATLTTSSSALLTVLTDNDYTGETTVRGNIQLGNGGATGSLGLGKINFTLAGKTLSYDRTNSLTISNQITSSSSGNFGTVAVNSGTLTLAGATDNTSLKVTVISNATVVLAKTAGNAVGTGTLIVDAGGVAKIGANNAQINGNANNQIDGTMDLQGFNQTIRVVTGVPCTGVIDSTVFGAGGCTLSVGNSSVAQSFAGEIKDSGWDATHKLALNKTGGQVVELGGTNTYHGNTTISQGTLKVMSATAIPHGANFGNVVFSGGSLQLNGYDITLNGISGSDGISDSTAMTTMLTVGDGAATASHSGSIGGSFGVTKIGVGVQTFTGTKNYTGSTVISNGTLRINGTLANSPSVTVAAQGTLGGTGTIAGVVTNNAGGTLSPGIAIGTLTINSDLTLEAGSTNIFEVNGSTATNDVVVLGASVTYGGVLSIVPTGLFTNGQAFELFSGAGAASASYFDSITVSSGGGLSFAFTNGVLTVLSAPAPQPTIAPVTVSGTNLVVSVPTVSGANYVLQSATNLTPTINWQNESTNAGTGGNLILNVPLEPAQPQKFLRFWVY
jgi:autotransporter-associated beta strand protein